MPGDNIQDSNASVHTVGEVGRRGGEGQGGGRSAPGDGAAPRP